MKHAILVSAFFLVAGAHAAEKPAAPVTETSAAVVAATPAQACNLLVEAAKTENFATVQALSTMPGRAHAKSEGKFNKMHNDYLAKIKGITCGAEHVADGHAVVEAQAEGKKRLIPFVSENGNWKFNMQAYKAFYDDAKGPKSRKKM